MKADPTLLRLRRANPVPEPAVADAGDLFARITDRAPDRRLRRRSPQRRRMLVAAVAIVAVALLASTAFAISSWLGDSVKPDVTKQEYREAQAELTLPPGYRWPRLHVDANSVTGRGAGGGHAVLIAQNDWECYWAHAIRSGDERAGRRAHSVLEGLVANNMLVAPVGAPENWVPQDPPDRPFVVFAADGGLEWIRESYTLAAAGHPQRLIQSCRANAPG
jgi:hypothetical protein